MTTQTPAEQGSPELGWCAWHKGQAAVRLIHVDYQGPGPDTPVPRSACLRCRYAYNLVPLAYPPHGCSSTTGDTT